ncbi:MAG: hypothetical protein WD717_04375 [Nitrosarchaeum sp.]
MVKKVRGFRIDNDLLKKLSEKATQKGTNLNNFIGLILEMYNTNYNFYESTKHMIVNPKIMKTVLDKCDQDMIKCLSHIYTEDLKNQMVYSTNKITLNTLLITLEKNCSAQGQPFQINHEKNEIHYIVFHGINEQWGHIMELSISNILKSINEVPTNITPTEEFVKFSIRENLL